MFSAAGSTGRGRALVFSCLCAPLAIAACGDGIDVRLGAIRGLHQRDASVSGTGGAAPHEGGPPGAADGNYVVTACADITCRIASCEGGAKTSVSGVVYDPAGKVPLFNVVVYVPGDKLGDIPTGVPQCQTCSGFFSGRPIAATLSGTDGSFRLENVPSGAAVPLVIQVGKWRRAVTVPNVSPCTETVVDPDLTRLPRDQSEGHIPKIAISTGGSDALECLVLKAGIRRSEFTNDKGTGRVHLFYGSQWIQKTQTVVDEPSSMADGTPLTSSKVLWSDQSLLDRYDMMLLSCEGTNANHIPRTAVQYQNVRDFADQGGRIYGSHWHHDWIDPNAVASDDPSKPDPYPQVVNFPPSAHGIKQDPISVSIDTSFPKGRAFAEWLFHVGASSTQGSIDIRGAEHSVDSVVPGASFRWIYGTDDGDSPPTPMVQYFSFNTPVGGTECGRMVFSDVHVSAGAGTASGKLPFPEGCNTGDGGSDELSPQEKALEFMIFDLSSCVQPDKDLVLVPPIH